MLAFHRKPDSSHIFSNFLAIFFLQRCKRTTAISQVNNQATTGERETRKLVLFPSVQLTCQNAQQQFEKRPLVTLLFPMPHIHRLIYHSNNVSNRPFERMFAGSLARVRHNNIAIIWLASDDGNRTSSYDMPGNQSKLEKNKKTRETQLPAPASVFSRSRHSKTNFFRLRFMGNLTLSELHASLPLQKNDRRPIDCILVYINNLHLTICLIRIHTHI